MRTVEEKKDAKIKWPTTRVSADPGPSAAAAVYGFRDDDLENQAANAAWGGRSAWRGLGWAQALSFPDVEASAEDDGDDGLGAGVDNIETHMSVFTFLKIVSERRTQ